MKKLLFLIIFASALVLAFGQSIGGKLALGGKTGLTAPAGGGTAYVTSVVVGTTLNGTTALLGFRMDMGGSPVTITHLGRYCVSGNSQTHTVYLLAFADGAERASASVNMSGCSAGTFVYATPTCTVSCVLAASTNYFVVSSETNGGDSWANQDDTLTVTAVASLIGAVGGSGVGACCTPDGTGNIGYVPPNFKY